MNFTRRQFALSAGVFALAACNQIPTKADQARRRYVINGNMYPPQNADTPLDPETAKQVQSTGLSAVKFSIGGASGTYDETIEMLDGLKAIYEQNPSYFQQVDSISDLEEAHDAGRVGIIHSFESATMFEGSTDRIREFAERGIRIMQLGYNTTNEFCAGIMSTEGPLGLSPLGREAVAAMEQSRVLIDLSHAHEKSAADVLAIAKKPASFTHTGCDAINPHQRNKSDQIMRSLAEQGGVMGIYEMSYLTPDLEQQSLEAFLAHLDHAVKICGEDHVGIGSDAMMLGFDTSPESMAQWNALNEYRKEIGIAAPGEGPPPFVEGLNVPDKMPRIAMALSRRGYTSAAVDKIMGQNFARIFAEAW